MTRRVPIRLVRLLAVASACLLPAAAAHAAPPPNDVPTTATIVPPLGWTSLSVSQDIVVQATDWEDATTGLEDGDPPTCTGAIGFRSMWYAVTVPEASVLRVTVVSTDTNRYQPVVTVLLANDEIACGVAALGRPGATATATAYVTPTTSASGATTAQVYLVRVAQVLNNSPLGGLPMLTVRFAGRDVTPPLIDETSPGGPVQPGAPTDYNAGATTDNGSNIDPTTPTWHFHDSRNGHTLVRTLKGMRVTYRWNAPGARQVDFDVRDRAGNESMYRFTTFVLDTVRPAVSFELRPPAPGAHRLRLNVKASESVRLSLLVTQAGRRRPLLRRTVSFWGDASHSRSIPLNGGVGGGLMFISGIARDLAGNATPLPQCMVDPVTGQGSCPSP
jgi:hypothetical protein